MVYLTLYYADIEQASDMFYLDQLCYKQSLNMEQWQKLLVKLNTVGVVLKQDTDPIAFIVVNCTNSGAEVLRCGVHPDWRRKKLGKTLIQLVGNQVDLTMRLRETNRVGLEFAKSLGFKTVGIERGGWGNEDGIVLERSSIPSKTGG